MIIQQRFNVLLQLQFYNIFTNVLSKVFTDILKIYELPKLYNKMPKYCQTLILTIIIYQANSMSQLHLTFELYPPLLTLLKMYPRAKKTLLVLKFKKSQAGYFYKM